MRIQFILHAEFESPGVIADWVDQKGFEAHYCRPFAEESIPDVNEFDWLVVMGGPQSPLELELYPYLKGEMELIEHTLSTNKPILGICLGAQLIGEVLGAPTERSPHKEVGIFPIQLTEEGQKDPLFQGFPAEFPVVHWHNDMPGLTQEARVLALSQGCPRQIIKYTNQVYAFQCHLEPTQQDIAGMIKHCESDLVHGKYVQSKQDLLAGDFSSINSLMHSILDGLLKLEQAFA